MEELKSISVVSKSALRDYVGKEGALILVACEGKPLMVLSSGRPVHVFGEVPSVLKDVGIYRIDKWELLDALHGDLKLPQKTGRAVNSVPRVVGFSMSLDVPPELMLKVENAVLDFVKMLSREDRVAVSSINAKGRVRQGFTGTNILTINVSAEGYTTVDVSPESLARDMASLIEEAVGFKVRVYVREANFQRVSELPIVKFKRSFVNFRGGRILEVPLHTEKRAVPKVDRARVEVEVEKLLKEAGISRELVEAAKGNSGQEDPRIDTGKIEHEILNELSTIGGVSLNWVKLTKGPSGYKVLAGLNRTSRELADSELISLAREALKQVESKVKALAGGAGFENAYIVIENDIY